jgi:SOS-response transcriptional repressor LexA
VLLSQFPFSDPVHCGFPSPTADYFEQRIDLNELLIPHPSSTYTLRVSGESMIGAILDGSFLLVDFSLTPQHNDIVVSNIVGVSGFYKDSLTTGGNRVSLNGMKLPR